MADPITTETPPNPIETDARQLEQPALDTGVAAPDPADRAPGAPAADAPDPNAPPLDARAARMEAIAEARQAERTAELAQQREVTNPAPASEPTEADRAAAAAAADAADPMMTIKVRGVETQMRRSEVIARAQKVEAADDYLSESRRILDEAKRERELSRANPTPAPAADPAPAQKPKIRDVLEQVQNGADPDEAGLLLEQTIEDRVTSMLDQRTAATSTAEVLSGYDADFERGMDSALKEYPKVGADFVGKTMVQSTAGVLQSGLIAQYLMKEDTPTEIKTAFEQAGITPQRLRGYSPENANLLYRDMISKGFALAPPSAVILAAGKMVHEKLTGATPAPTTIVTEPPAALDRTTRKEAAVQPERTTVPRAPQGLPPTAKTEAERAADARAEMRAGRRGGR